MVCVWLPTVDNLRKSEQKQPGWTLWAVFGGIASCLGLLSQQWENGGVKVADAAQLLLLASMIRDILHYARRQLSPVQQRTYKVSPRFNLLTGLESPSGMCLCDQVCSPVRTVSSICFASALGSMDSDAAFLWIFTLAGAIGLAPPTSTF